MKCSAFLAGLALAASATLASAHEFQYAATLDGPSESPPQTTAGIGNALVTVDTDLATMRVEVSFAGLSGTTTASHIHCCTAVAGAGTVAVATQLPTFPGFPLGVMSGAYDQTFDLTDGNSYNPAFVTANGSVGGAENALIAGLDTGKAYLNIHTTFAPGGEIRGFLQAVPEPEIYGIFLAGLGLLVVTVRRRIH